MTPGCSGLIDPAVGVCPVCSRNTIRDRYDKRRGTTAQRGYGPDWRALRARKLRKNKWCEDCHRTGVRTKATEVHHVESFDGLDDPLRLMMSNLRSSCNDCHKRYATGLRR